MLPKGLHRIRHYGLFANGDRAAYIVRARELLGVPSRSKPANTSEATASAEPRMKATRVRHGTGKPSTVEAAFEANHVIPVNGSRVGNFYTLSKRRCGPPLTSPLDRAAVAPSELSASELGHPRMNISADGHCRYFKPNWSMLLPLALDVDAVGKT